MMDRKESIIGTMSLKDKKKSEILAIRERIKLNKLELNILNKTWLRAIGPDGYPEGTSYLDADTIHGSRKEWRVEDYLKEKLKIKTMIELDENKLKNLLNEVNTKEYIKTLKTNEDKIKFLRFVKGYTQEETSKIIYLSVRQIQRIEKKLKENMSC